MFFMTGLLIYLRYKIRYEPSTRYSASMILFIQIKYLYEINQRLFMERVKM